VVHVIVHPEVKNWLKYARFEEKNQFISSARQIYERAVEYFGDENIDEGLLIAFAKFEEGQREVGIMFSIVLFRQFEISSSEERLHIVQYILMLNLKITKVSIFKLL